MKSWLSLAASALVALLLASAVLAYIFALGNQRAVATLLFASGAVAVLAASYVASGLVVARSWFAILPSRRHPLAVVWSGVALCALAAFLLFEV
jgi:hypothetical protein